MKQGGRAGLAALAALACVTMGGLVPPPSAAGEPADLVEIHRTTSEAGFSHPGVGLTADNLENMRTQVLAGVEPWASYYAAMTQTRYAAADFKASIQGPTDEQPTSVAYDNASMRSKQHTDSIGAMTQALLYVVTGEEVYRANALHVVRTWSSLDPARYRYFADSHIHTGVPLYQTLVAAEILRSTEPVHDTLDGYDLRWTARDTQRIEDNLIDPVVETFLFSQNRLWNQHLYGVIGMIAAAIFTDDADLYAERVEWFTVNSTYTPEIPINGGDVSGSLADLVRIIDADHPGNTTGQDFVQVMEMGRDQAHAEGDIDLLAAIARVVHNQGTRLDPVAGTVSTAPGAVSPYEFLGNRILAGGNAFYAFMMGEDLPWVDTSGGSGKLAEGYRGRLREPLSELYLQYKYVTGVDVEREAPFVAEQYAHRDGPLFYWGAGVSNFWNESGSDFTGAEYWVAFPPQLAGQDITVPAAVGPELALRQFGHTLGKGAKQLTDDGASYVRLVAHKSDATVAVRRAVWADRSRSALVGLKVRTHGGATLRAARTSRDDPFATIRVPDTGGRWRYVWMDISTAKVARVGDNIVYLTATGSHAHIDVAGLLADANGTLAPPVFDDGGALSVVAVAGEPYARTLGVGDPDGDFALGLQGAPRGVRVAADGSLSWLPRAKDQGTEEFLVVASDDTADTTLPVTVTVAPDRPAAIDALISGLQPRDAYTTATWQPVAAARSAAEAATASADSARFANLLEDLRVAVAGLQPLNPRLPDGTLDYSRIVISPDFSAATLATIVDGDNQTFWGDIRRPSVLLDFGAGYRYRADAIGWLARDTFPDRSRGANAYGSNDGATWTLLTERGTVGSDVALETIPVRAEARDQRFRYLKLQADQPANAIFSMADVRLHGERFEAGLETLLAEATAQDLSGYSRASAVLFTREIEAVAAAAAEPSADPRALAVRILTAWDLLEPPPYEAADIEQAWVTASTPSWDGTRSAAANGWVMFDGDPATFTDTQQASGWVSVVPPPGTTLHVQALRYLPRTGYVSRAEGMRLQGSPDGGQTWQDLVTLTGAKEGWNQIALPAAADTTALRLVSATGNMNMADVQIVTSTVDRTALDLFLAETADLQGTDWTGESWQTLTDAVTTATAVAADEDADQADVDTAAQHLRDAIAGLERR